jgi:hypothetical protein
VHASAADEPAGQYWPAAQWPVTAARPDVAQNEPPVHGIGAATLAPAHSEPIGHATAAEPPPAAKLPAVAAVCAVAPGAQNEPAVVHGDRAAAEHRWPPGHANA